MNIPLFKVYMAPESIESAVRVLGSGYIGQGLEVDKFEHNLAKFIGNPLCLTTNSGTSALHLALHLIGVGKGDEVISSPMTCTATNWGILAVGARPIWCDIDPRTGNIDPIKIQSLITEKTKAIMIVDWGGVPCDLDSIMQCQAPHYIPIIEDAAHGFGSEYRGRRIGTIANYTCFSFQAIKHLTTIDGGALFLKDEEQYRRGKLIRWYGIDREGERRDFRCEGNIPEWGYKFHMNDVCASIGLGNFTHIDSILQAHRDNAYYYTWELWGVPGIELLNIVYDTKPSWWLYTILVERRDDFVRKMSEYGIMCSRVHERNDKHSCVSEFKRELPGVDEFVSKEVCIPVGWWVTPSDREYIVECIKGGW